MNLQLTVSEQEWLNGTLDREALRILTLTAKEQRQRLPQKVLALRLKIKESVDLTIEVDRNDLKILQQQTANYITTIRTKTLPEHEKRIASGDEKAVAHYTPYRDALVARVEVLERLLTKVEGLL